MTDLSRTIAPKSDQLNADDLLTGPRTITIRKVSADPSSSEQPVSIFFEGDDGKPYKPCKSMRRVMVAAWQADGSKYPGRSMTLYRDPEVMFGGLKVGGIRISHMSHIESELALALTATRGAKKAFKVKPLRNEPPPRQEERRKDAPTGTVPERMIAAIRGAQTIEALDKILNHSQFDREYRSLGPDDAERVDLEADNRRLDLNAAAYGDEGGSYAEGSDSAQAESEEQSA